MKNLLQKLGGILAGVAIAFSPMVANATTFNVPLGGTGVGSFSAHAILLGNGTSPIGSVSPGTAGFVLTSNGASADPTFQAASAFSTSSAAYWLTTKTTDNLTEGVSNLYWTITRFDNRLSATTTLPSITTLANLSTVSTSLTGLLKATSGVLSAATAGTDYLTPSTAVTSVKQTYGAAQTGAITVGTSTAATNNGVTVGQTITNSSGIFTFAPTVSVSAIPIAALAASTISGISLGSNLNSLTHDSTLSGTSYNGSAAVSDWGLNLATANSWTGKQTFANASTTYFSSSYASSTAAVFGALTLANITGTQCLHSVSGVVSGTGADCGSGSGGSISTSTALANGQVDFSTGVATIGNDSNFFWDNTNKRLGIGSSTPIALLSVTANALASGVPQFAVGSSTGSAFLIDQANNIGINKTNPISQLEIADNLNTSGGSDSHGTGGLRISRANSPSQFLALNEGGASAHTIQGFGSKEFAIINNAPAPNAQGNINFYTNYTALGGSGIVLSITPTDKVGIGTTTPWTSLEVASNTPQIGWSNQSAGTNLKHWYSYLDSNGALNFGTSTDGLATSSPYNLTLQNNGNVGIGSSTTNALFAVGNGLNYSDDGSAQRSLTILGYSAGTAGNPTAFFGTTGGSSGVKIFTRDNSNATVNVLKNNGTNGVILSGASGLIGVASGGGLQWGNNNADSTIDAGIYRASSGVLEIGNTSSASANGTLLASTIAIGTSTPYSKLTVWGADTTSAALVNFVNSASTTIARFQNDGSVGIGTTSPGTLFSIGNTGGINLGTGTSTWNTTGGIELAGGGCFSQGGTCLQTYIQNASAYKQAANYATAAVLAGTPSYANGTAGVGATLTEVGFGALSVDGQAPTVGQRILVKNQADQTQNGVYTVTVVGSGIASYVLTRSTDYNQSVDIYAGTTIPVLSGGTANGDTQWTESTTGTITVGSSNIVFQQTASGSGGSSGVSSLAQSFGSAQTGVLTLATSSAVSFNGLTLGHTITNSSGTFTFANTLTGTLNLAGGGTATTTSYAGGIIFSDGSKLTQSAAQGNLFWDETNKRLGIGTTSPSSALTIGGNVTIGAASAGGTNGTLTVPSLGTSGGSFLWADGNGLISATTSPIIASTTAMVPRPAYGGTGAIASSVAWTGNTTAVVNMFVMAAPMTLNKINFDISAVGTSGTVQFAIYSADGQTRYLNQTSGTINSTGLNTLTLTTPVYLPAGMYWFSVTPRSTISVTPFYFAQNSVESVLGSGTYVNGVVTVSAGTAPTTITPANMSQNGNAFLPVMYFY